MCPVLLCCKQLLVCVQLKALQALVFSNVKPKSMYGRPLSGSMLASLADIYCTALNENKAPEIRGAWERVAEQQCQEAADAVFIRYKSDLLRGTMSGTAALDDLDLQQLHDSALATAITCYHDTAVLVCAVIIAD